MRNSRSGAPSNLGPTSSRSALRFLCVNDTARILRFGRCRFSEGAGAGRRGAAKALYVSATPTERAVEDIRLLHTGSIGILLRRAAWPHHRDPSLHDQVG